MSEVRDRYPLAALPRLYLMRQHPPPDHDDVAGSKAQSQAQVFNPNVPPSESAEGGEDRIRLWRVLRIGMPPGVAIVQEFAPFVHKYVVRTQAIVARDTPSKGFP